MEHATYNHEPIEDATLDGLTKTEGAKIAGELGLTSVESISAKDKDGHYKVELVVDGGFTAFVEGNSIYGIKSVIGTGSPETISLHIAKKNV